MIYLDRWIDIYEGLELMTDDWIDGNHSDLTVQSLRDACKEQIIQLDEWASQHKSDKAELLKLREFVFIMVKEGATTLSKAKNLLGLESMEEARTWYESLNGKEVSK